MAKKINADEHTSKERSKGKTWTNKHLLPCILVAAVFIAFIIHIAFSISAPCKFLEAKWQAGDILTYVSTVALGALAVWQNMKYEGENQELQKRVLQVEENAYVNDNACFALIENISISGQKQTACNLSLHLEQVVNTSVQDPEPFSISSLVFNVRMKNLNKNIPTLIRIKEFEFCSAKEGVGVSLLSGIEFDDSFSRIALTEESVDFQVTVFLSRDDKKAIIDNMKKQNNKIMIEFVVELLTHKNVATKLKCRTTFEGKNFDAKGETYSEYEMASGTSPYCFLPWN